MRLPLRCSMLWVIALLWSLFLQPMSHATAEAPNDAFRAIVAASRSYATATPEIQQAALKAAETADLFKDVDEQDLEGLFPGKQEEVSMRRPDQQRKVVYALPDGKKWEISFDMIRGCVKTAGFYETAEKGFGLNYNRCRMGSYFPFEGKAFKGYAIVFYPNGEMKKAQCYTGGESTPVNLIGRYMRWDETGELLFSKDFEQAIKDSEAENLMQAAIGAENPEAASTPSAPDE